MRRFIFTLILSLLIFASLSVTQAQSLSISVGEISQSLPQVSGSTQFTEQWTLNNDIAGTIPVIRASRIGGQLTPTLRLYNSAGDLLAESIAGDFPDTAELIYETGLSDADAPYTIEVVGDNVITQARNPAEYSLSIFSDGARRITLDDDIDPLPAVATEAPAELATGDAQNIGGINLPIFGLPAEITDRTGSQIMLSADSGTVSIGQSAPLTNITFLDTGVGVGIQNENLLRNPNRRFVSDEDFTVTFNEPNYTFTMNSGMVIVTSFAQVESIEIQNGVAGVRLLIGDDMKRIVSDAQSIIVQRIGNDTPNYRFEFDGNTIVTDTALWDVLAYYQNQVRLYVGESRFISDSRSLNITGNIATNQQFITFSAPVLDTGTTDTLNLNIDWSRLGQIAVTSESITTTSRNGIDATESLNNVESVLVRDGAVQFTRRDEIYRTMYPDGTDISSPRQLPSNSDLLPYELGFRTRNYNNLGADILPTCPCSDDLQAHTPVNPVNGNFFYSVTDFSTRGQSLALNLERFYNSHDNRYGQGVAVDSRLTPRYILNAPVPYARFGNGWRHSYQYEVDIAGAPLGRITFIEPDGTGHYFTPIDGSNNSQWTSQTLRSMVIFREGILGTWRAEQTDGVHLYFDRVGRLTRINQDQQSIIMIPAPHNYVGDTFVDGVFVVETYGRRIELYNGDIGRVELARDSELSEIFYNYDGAQLTNVQYEPPASDIVATYEYSFGLLTAYNDVRSPYTQTGSIAYDPQNRVGEFVENPNTNLSRQFVYFYPDDDESRVVDRVFEVGDERRVQSWTYNDFWQLTRLTLPEDGWDYQFTYNIATGNIESIQVPTGVTFNLEFDARGNLTRFEDPLFVENSAYNLTYEQRGTRSLLTQIRYPNNRTETFAWSNTDYPRLIAQETLVSIGAERVRRETQFEYDNFGRLILRIDSGNIGTRYSYDDIGYVSEIWDGIELRAGETYVDISEPERAARITQYDYDLSGLLQQYIDGRDLVYNISWTRSGRILSISTIDDLTVTYDYNVRGLVRQVNDRGQETLYTYNGLDQVTNIVSADGAQETFTYDEADNLLTRVDDLELTTQYEYDSLDNLSSVRTSAGQRTLYTTTLNADANAIIRTQEDLGVGRTVTYRYNFLGRLVQFGIAQEGDSGEFQSYRLSYSSEGYLVGVEDTLIGDYTLAVAYNLVGDPLQISVNDSDTEFTYNERGLVDSVTSPQGAITRYDYDALGNITTVTLPDNTQWTYTYDANGNLRSATNPLGLTTNYVPDRLNRISTIEDPLDNIESFNYDARGNLITQTDANQISTTYAYDVLDRLTRITDPRGNTTIYAYDPIGRLETITQTDASPATRLTYDNNNNIIAVNEQRQRTLYSYDALGRITSITDPLGHTTTYQYNPVGFLTNIQDALGNSESFQWSSGTNFLSQYTRPNGQVYDIRTDALGRVSSILLTTATPDGSEPIDTQIFYTPDGYVSGIQTGTLSARTSGNSDLFYQFAYDTNGNPVTYSDPLGNEWDLRYDDAGRLIETINPQGTRTQFQYDSADRITTVIHNVGEDTEYTATYTYSPSGNITAYEMDGIIRNEYEYFQNNLLSQATLAVGTDATAQYLFDYNAFGNLELLVEPNGVTTRYQYPLSAPTTLARVTMRGGELQFIRSYTYDDADNLVSASIADAEDINISYDALDRRVRYVDSADNSWAYTYDANGNIAQISDPLGSVIAYTYDAYDRVTQIQYPSGNTVNLSYRGAGNLNLSTVTLPANVNGTRQQVQYVLDEIGQIRQMQVGTDFVVFDYDEMGNVIRRTAPDGIVTNYTYDTTGQLLRTNYSSQDAPIDYRYDSAGNLEQAGNIEFSYDVLGRMIGASDNNTLIYNYDTSGNLNLRSSDLHGATTYTYDDLARVQTLNFDEAQVDVTYDDKGLIDTIIRDGNIATNIDYDENDRITVIRHINIDTNTLLDFFAYTYDAVGNLIKVERQVDGRVSEVSYSYDIDQRLISERWLNSDGETFYLVNYRYDGAGNRIEENRNGRVTTFSYNGQNQLIRENRNLSSDGSEFMMLPSVIFGIFGLVFVRRRRRLWIVVPIVTGLFVGVTFAQTNPQIIVAYEYDSNGNMTLIRYNRDEVYELDYDYDSENRLIAVSGQTIAFDDDGDEIGVSIDTNYSYDEFSRVVGITTADTTFTLYYDGHTLIGMSDGESTERYLSLDGQRILTRTDDGENLWNLNDRQGSTGRYVAESGNLVDDPSRRLEFGAFGIRIFPYDPDRVAPNGARIDQPAQFLGGALYDPSTRIYFMGVRAYDPIVGRFLQPDPIRQDPVGNLYTYSRNRPLVFDDPTGMTVEPFLQPLTVANSIQEVDPQMLLPLPNTEPFTVPNSVHHLQSNEAFRALQLLEATRYGVNNSVFQLSPLNNDVYLFDINPIPLEISQLVGESLRNTMSIYENGDGWIPNPRPNPVVQQNPFAALDAAMPTLNQPYIDPFTFTGDLTSLDFAPDVSVPDAFSHQMEVEQALIQLMQPIQPMIAFGAEAEFLLELVPPTIEPTVTLPQVALPSAMIEPAILSDLDDLREQTFDFYSRIWVIGNTDCDDCVPSLGFNQ